ncbi:MAG: thioesterase family protein [Ignavibacteria bacterium]|nr:thioesterase family protein [Ignavibacteria bacterium]
MDNLLTQKDFKHCTIVKVRFNEVDMLGVCNNAVYINYFEHSRLEYVKSVGLMPGGGIFSDDEIYFMVRNEINYRSHSRYDDELAVFTRISYIKNSSYGFDHLVINTKTDQIIADGKGVVAHVDKSTGKSTPLSDEFITIVKTYEPNIKILR